MRTSSGVLAVLFLTGAIMSAAAYQTFDSEFFVNFGQANTKAVGPYEKQLGLTNSTGSGFRSKQAYLFGYIAMKLKLVAGDSAGIVTSYYLSSLYENHCELDFEFLGNRSGQPYALQTNVFVEGIGQREQRITLWFDPSAAFHTYGILWNMELILFFVDDRVIRVFRNVYETLGVPYLNYQEMYSFSSIWDGSSWATSGGKYKADWSLAPFVASYTDFDIEACAVVGPIPASRHPCYAAVYNKPYGNKANQTLSAQQWDDLAWIQKYWLTYDYCTDSSRWKTQPKECAENWPRK
jgi:xyloglucan:xyloglucosyl transferase